MANLLRRLTGRADPDEHRFSIDQWLTEYLLPANQFSFNGTTYPFGGGTLGGNWNRETAASLQGFSSAIRACPPAFAAQMVRASVLSQARFTFRNRPGSASPRRTFGSTALAPLEQPWPGATTGELISRMEWHAGLAGNSYVTNHMPGRLRVLRPDWVAILYGSQREPDDPAHALDGEVIGYLYRQGGFNAGNDHRLETLLPVEVAHWAPLPDPENAGLGMPWLAPALREMELDQQITRHKLAYFLNGATPNLVVSGIPAATKEKFDEMVDAMEATHKGAANAYRTLYLTLGASAEVIGSNLKDSDFKGVQGTSETRISALSRVPASLLGISEGLQGSSLNAGNWSSARRSFADSWVYPTLQDLSGSLASLVKVPSDAELWFDTTDMPFLREDAKDAAEIQSTNAITIRELVNAGFEPKSVLAAVQGQNMSLLVHSGLVSVQLQAPGSMTTPALGAAADPKALSAPSK